MRSEKQSSEIFVGEYQRRRQLERKICLWNASLVCSRNAQSTRNIICACVLNNSVISNSLWPMDGSPPGSSTHGIFQARILEWDAFSPPGDLPNPGIKPVSPKLVGGLFYHRTIWEDQKYNARHINNFKFSRSHIRKVKMVNILIFKFPVVYLKHLK